MTLESALGRASVDVPTAREVFWRKTVSDRNLSSISQTGLVNNLNDGMAWGLFPLFFAGAGISLDLGIGVVIVSGSFVVFAAGAALLGLGTAMVYPTLLAAISDVAAPGWRASAIGVYRFWRDLGYAIGAVVAGVSADVLGIAGAMWVVAGMTLASGLVAAFQMSETKPAL